MGAFRPAAIGITLHLALDFPFLQLDWRVWRRAGRHCERCGAHGQKRGIVYILPPRYRGARWALDNRAVWCEDCMREVYR